MKALKKISSIMLLVPLLLSCQSDFVHDVETTDNSVIVDNGQIVTCVEIVDESIIHVKKQLKGAAESTVPDYVTVLEPQNIDWKLKQSKDKITITTENIKVYINSDGTIDYKDRKGGALVSETNDKTYIATSEREDGTTASQSFTVGDEALYGLGQYQSGIMNWKNVPLRMQQYNQEAVVPFLVSTKNYGIYWNSYAVTYFNIPENEILFEDGAVLDQNKEDLSGMDVENVINAKQAATNEDNIRETIFVPEKTGQYTFFVESDLGSRMRGKILLTLDDIVVVDYSTVWVPTSYSGKADLEAGREYKLVFQNKGAKIPGRVMYNEPDFNKTVFSSKSGSKIDYYIMVGDTPAEVIGLNHKLTGQTPLFEKRAYGFWQCRERYHNQQELLENAREMRARQVPFDIIIQDWFYWPDKTKGPEWDRAKYPDPEAMAAEVHELNANLMVSVWPTVTNDPMLKKYDLDTFKLGGNNLDFYDQGVQERYYQMLRDSMYNIGVNSIWLDGSEGNAASSDIVTAVGPIKDVANVYSLLVSKSLYDGKQKECPNERVLNLTRSAFSGQQRNGVVTWSGDVASSWKQFAEQISAGLNFTMAGIPYWTHDIGGFFRDSQSMNPTFDDQYTNDEFIELMARWFQFGAFSPIFRVHGYRSNTEIWRYSPEFEAMARKFIDLRYQLMPYIYTQAWNVTDNGALLMSPLAYTYPNDKKGWEVKDQLLFGESLMLAFVTEYEQREKEVYLPEADEWYDFWTSQKMDRNGYVTVETPFDQTPIFVKAGSIVPFGPKVQYATQPTDEPMVIKIYAGKDAEYTLYLDDNTTNDYRKGKYSLVEFLYDDSKEVLEIAQDKDDYTNFKNNPMKFVIEIVGTDKTQEVIFEGSKVELKF